MRAIRRFSLALATLALGQASYGQYGYPQQNAAPYYWGNQAAYAPMGYGYPGYYAQPRYGYAPAQGYYAQPQAWQQPQAAAPSVQYVYVPYAVSTPQAAPVAVAPVVRPTYLPETQAAAPLVRMANQVAPAVAAEPASAPEPLSAAPAPMPSAGAPATLAAEPATQAKPSAVQSTAVSTPSLAECASGYCPSPGLCCDDGPQFWRHRFGGFADFLYLTPRGADVVYAQPRDGVANTAVPRGPQAVADPDYSGGFRVGGTVALCDKSSIVLTYSWFDSSTTSLVSAQNGTFLHSLTNFPATANCAADSLAAAARYDIDFRLVDLDYKSLIAGDCNYGVNYLVGVRYANLREDFRGRYSIFGETNVLTAINFDGVGPRAGLDGEWMGKSGFLVYGRGVLDLLIGHFGAGYIQRNNFAGVQAQIDYTDDRIVPVLEMELGIGWSTQSGRFRVMTGYYIAGWFNTVLTPDLIQSVRTNNFTTNMDNLDNTLTFDGLTTRVEFRF